MGSPYRPTFDTAFLVQFVLRPMVVTELLSGLTCTFYATGKTSWVKLGKTVSFTHG